jgi:HEPN domain-containing protein
MDRTKEIARAYLIESEVDFEVSRILYQNGYNSRTVFFAQQASEKIVKACLAMKGIYITDHNLSSIFTNVFREQIPEVDRIVTAITELERHGTRSRFPLYHRPNLPIWIPSKEYKVDDAMNCLANLDIIFTTLKEFLDNRL